MLDLLLRTYYDHTSQIENPYAFLFSPRTHTHTHKAHIWLNASMIVISIHSVHGPNCINLRIQQWKRQTELEHSPVLLMIDFLRL